MQCNGKKQKGYEEFLYDHRMEDEQSKIRISLHDRILGGGMSSSAYPVTFDSGIAEVSIQSKVRD